MDNAVKLFNLRLSGEFHQAIKEKAEEENTSIHQFIIDAIAEKMQKQEVKQ